MIKVISFEERLKRPPFIKGAIFGKSGVGKTSLLKTLNHKALLVDLEAGDLSLQEWEGDKVTLKTWEEVRDLCVLIAGVDPSVPEGEPFSQGDFDRVEKEIGKRADVLGKYETIFIDSITVMSRLCLSWSENQADNQTRGGEKNMLAAYGALGRDMMRLLTRVQHTPDKNILFVGILDEKTDEFNRVSFEPQMDGGKIAREISGIVDLVLTMAFTENKDGQMVRAFFTSADNELGYPAKDRSGKLREKELANLQTIFDKINNKKEKADA